jgi:predicted DCC family thiol-disulfide oxidoreductase YuxK
MIFMAPPTLSTAVCRCGERQAERLSEWFEPDERLTDPPSHWPYFQIPFGAKLLAELIHSDEMSHVPASCDVQFIFDGDCAFCTAATSSLQRTFRLRGDAVPASTVDLDALGLTPEDVQRQAWFSDGRELHGGAAAIAAWMRTGGPVSALLGWSLGLPIVRAVAAIVYRLVAHYRRRIPGPWSKSCEI